MHLPDSRICEAVQDEGSGERGVPAQLDFPAGREPFEVIPALPFPHHERGLGVIVLDRDLQHQVGRRH